MYYNSDSFAHSHPSDNYNAIKALWMTWSRTDISLFDHYARDNEYHSYIINCSNYDASDNVVEVLCNNCVITMDYLYKLYVKWKMFWIESQRKMSLTQKQYLLSSNFTVIKLHVKLNKWRFLVLFLKFIWFPVKNFKIKQHKINHLRNEWIFIIKIKFFPSKIFKIKI